MNVGRYNKGLVAAGAALAVLASALADGHLTATEIVGVAIAFIGALTVYAVPNKPEESK